MLKISSEDLKRLLGISSVSKETVHMQRNNNGTGKFDLRQALNGQSAFTAYLAENPELKKNKIIFAAYSKNEHVSGHEEMAFLRALTESNYEIYIWGNKLIRIKDAEDLWKKFHNIQKTDKKTIEKQLGIDNIACDEFVIIDNEMFLQITDYIKGPKDPNLKEVTINKYRLETIENLPKSLKKLCINGGKLIKPNLSGLIELEELTIEFCNELETIENLPKLLKKLCIRGIVELKNLDLSKLSNLEELTINLCNELETIENLPKSLKTLWINGRKLKNLDLSGLIKLEELTIECCLLETIKNLPESLKKLCICGIVELKKLDLSKLFGFEELEIKNCGELETIKNLPESLKKLCICGGKLKKPDFSGLINLEELTIKYCDELETIENLPKSLKTLCINGGKLKKLDLSKLSQLESLDISRCDNLKIMDLSNCLALHSLKLRNMENLNKIILKDLSQLESIELLGGFPENMTIIFRNLPNLKTGRTPTDQLKETFSGLPNLLTNEVSDSNSVRENSSSSSHQGNGLRAALTLSFSSSKIKINNNECSSSHNTSVHKPEISGELIYKGSPVLPTYFRLSISTKANAQGVLNSNDNDILKVKIKLNEMKNGTLDLLSQDNLNSKQSYGAFEYRCDDVDKYYPIPTLTSKDEMIAFYCKNPGNIEIYVNKETNQYFFKVKTASPAVTFCYQLAHKAAHITNIADPLRKNLPENSYVLIEFSGVELLPRKLQKKLKGLCEKQQKLNSFIFSREFSTEEKIRKLISFCQNFKDEEIEMKEKDDLLEQCILQERGSCNNRSLIFFYLARFIGVPARHIGNGIHGFVEIPVFIKETVLEYIGLDVGGGLSPALTDAAQKTHNDFSLNDASQQWFRTNLSQLAASSRKKLYFYSIEWCKTDKSIKFTQSGSNEKDLLDTALKGEIKFCEKIKNLQGNIPALINLWRDMKSHGTLSYQEHKDNPQDDLALLLSSVENSEIYGIKNNLFHCCILMILMRYNGVPARILIDDDGKTWVEQGISEGESLRWEKIDKKYPPPPKATGKKSDRSSTPFKSPFEKIAKISTNSAQQLLGDSSGKNILILLGSTQSPISAYGDLLRQIKNQSNNKSSQNYVFINSKDDMNGLLKTFKLEGKKVKRNIPGQLQEILTETGGIIVINWNNFNSEDIASFKSMMDETPILLDISITKPLKVIGLLSEDQRNKISDDVYSRCTLYKLLPNGLNVETNSADKDNMGHNEKDIQRIDLFYGYNWQDIIYGEYELNKSDVSYHKGAIQRAILDKKKALIFLNPPQNDPQFDVLIQVINLEKRIFLNGSYFNIPKDFYIHIDSVSPPFNLPDNVKFLHNTRRARKECLFLNIPDHHQWLKRLQIDDEGKGKTLPCLFQTYDDKTQEIFITENLPKQIWQRLLWEIKENYSQKQFSFVFANGVKIPDFLKESLQKSPADNVLSKNEKKDSLTDVPNENVPDAEINTDQSCVYSTNDPDFLAKKLKENLGKAKPAKQSTIINITPQTSYADLISEKSVTVRDDGGITFKYKRKSLLDTLKNGETIIINGTISPTLYQHLLSALSEQPYLWDNGQRVSLTGKLFIVMPKHAAQKVCGWPLNTITYDWKTYQEKFKNDQEIFLKIKTFYACANHIRHFGSDMPSRVLLSYNRIRNLISAIKQSRQRGENPIKGSFLFDYDKSSSEYAYLNVAAKLIFHKDNNLNPFIRKDKLEKLLQPHNLSVQNVENNVKYIWQLLNCFSADFIKEHIFKKLGILSCLNNSRQNSLPILSKEAFNNFKHVLNTVFHKKQTEFKYEEKPIKSRTERWEKQKNRLFSGLEHSDCNVFFLKGLQGSGKSHMEKDLKQKGFQVFFGEDKIQNWITSKNDANKPNILFLDEANIQKDGYWDFLNGIVENKTIFHNGQSYPLSENHKIIFTGNPETYAGRNYQRFFQTHAETILFKAMDDNFFVEKMVKPILGYYGGIVENASRKIIDVFNFTKRCLPKLGARDLQNLTHRFACLYQSNIDSKNSININTLLRQAVVLEFSFLFYNSAERTRFRFQIE